MTGFISESRGWGQRVTGYVRSTTTEVLEKRHIRSVSGAWLCPHTRCIFALSLWLAPRLKSCGRSCSGEGLGVVGLLITLAYKKCPKNHSSKFFFTQEKRWGGWGGIQAKFFSRVAFGQMKRNEGDSRQSLM